MEFKSVRGIIIFAFFTFSPTTITINRDPVILRWAPGPSIARDKGGMAAVHFYTPIYTRNIGGFS